MKNSQKGFVVPLLIVIAVLVIGGGVYYFSSKSKSSQVPSVTEQQSNTQPITQSTPPVTPTNNVPVSNTSDTAMGPKEAYLKMRTEFDKAQTFADILAITLKYGSKEQITKINTQKAQIDALPQEFKDGLVTQLKKAVPTSSEITSVQVTINGSKATLIVASTKGQTGTVMMTLEGKEWKFDSESWKSNK